MAAAPRGVRVVARLGGAASVSPSMARRVAPIASALLVESSQGVRDASAIKYAGVLGARSGGQLGLGRLRRHESCVRAAAAAHADLVAGGGAFEVVAEVVAELVAADVDR